MSVAKVSEISCTSTKSFEDAITQGLARASKTLRNIRSAWIKEQQVRCDGGRITEYQVNLAVTFASTISRRVNDAGSRGDRVPCT